MGGCLAVDPVEAVARAFLEGVAPNIVYRVADCGCIKGPSGPGESDNPGEEAVCV